MGNDPEIKALRLKQMKKFQKRIEQAQQIEERRLEVERKREQTLRAILTDEANVALEKIKSVNKGEAQTLEDQCLQLFMSGYLRAKITKKVLEELHLQLRRDKHETKFIRKSKKKREELFNSKIQK